MTGSPDAAKMPRLLAIGGQPRSGTSLLCTLCDQHPEMIVSSEFRVFDRLCHPHHEHIRRLRRNWWSFPYFAVSRHHPATILRNALFFSRYAAKMGRYRRNHIGIEEIRLTLGDLFPGVPVIGDKFPPYIWKFPEMGDLSSFYRVVIYRDPRDVVQSTLNMVNTAWRGRDFSRNLDTAEKIATKWANAMEMIHRYPEGIFLIRYEELVRDPGLVLDSLGQYLGVDPSAFSPDMVTSSSIGKYQDELTTVQVDSIKRIAGPVMELFGYE